MTRIILSLRFGDGLMVVAACVDWEQLVLLDIMAEYGKQDE